MGAGGKIARHYTRGNLLARLQAALVEDGANPDRPTLVALAPYDHFHGRGLEATEGLAEQLEVAPNDHLLDIGSGIGGPARYFADRFGCCVTGIDLTAEFCDVARHLTRLLGLDGQVAFEQGDALAMPFADASFDGAYAMNVSMNIADKEAFYREVYRVLRPGAWLVLSEIAQGPNSAIDYPTPWSMTPDTSFLASPTATLEGLEACGFVEAKLQTTLAEALVFGARSRALAERGEKPPHRAVQLIHGDIASVAAANIARGLAEGAIIPVEIHCRKSSTA
jgi:SAM-dependent methyltransferase